MINLKLISNFIAKKKQQKKQRKAIMDKLRELDGRRASRKFNVRGVTRGNRQDLLDIITGRYGLQGIGNINFVPDPENKYDANAIKIFFEGVGHIGYVPRERTDDIKSFLKYNTYDVKWNCDYIEKTEAKHSNGEDIIYMEIRLYTKK